MRRIVVDRSPTCQRCGAILVRPDGIQSSVAGYKVRVDHADQLVKLACGKTDYKSRKTDASYRVCKVCADSLMEVLQEWIKSVQ